MAKMPGFTHYGTKKHWLDLAKILHWGEILDVITLANFEFDRFRGFSVANDQTSDRRR